MGGFDTLALGISLIDPDNKIVAFNQKLHANNLYNAFQFSVGALVVFSGGMLKGMSNTTPSCFVAGTMVLTAAGFVVIENIRAGDKVVSTDTHTFNTDVKSVLETYVREVTKLVHLTIDNEEIITTVDHPFYVSEKGFINVGELKAGDKLIDKNGKVMNVICWRLELTDQPVKVYNFQVEDYHTYYVSRISILVHNAGRNYNSTKEFNEAISKMDNNERVATVKKEARAVADEKAFAKEKVISKKIIVMFIKILKQKIYMQ